MSTVASNQSFLGVHLSKGVSNRHMITFYAACLASIMLATFIPQSQPFLLTEFLQIPESRQGVVSGTLNFWAEIVIIICTAIFGSLSDRIGRRWVISIGFIIMAGGTYLYPHAETINMLLAYRLLYAVGIAAVSCMLVTIVADYAQDRSRGKATGYLGMMNGFGAMITVFLLLKLPAILQDRGMSVFDSGYYTYAIVASITLAMGLFCAWGLKPRGPNEQHSKESVLVLARQGITAARDPGVALAYGASFLARGNLMIVGTFFSLWVVNYGTVVMGLSTAESLAKAGAIIGIAQGCALLGAPVFGIMSDKMNRVHALIVALTVSAIGYSSTFFISNPFEGGMIVCAIFIGLGEIGCIITSGVLIAQQTPERIRGAAIGVFTMSGAIGILVASVAGGYLFDYWRPSGPFVFFGIIAAIILVWALIVNKKITPCEEQEEQSGLNPV